jgi:hypothetical protein
MRVLRIAVTVAFLQLVGSVATPSYAGVMSFSVYTDGSLNTGVTTFYATVTTSDNSTGCTHGNYTTQLNIYSPSSRHSVANASGLNASASLPINAEYGTYTVSVTGTYLCSCIFNNTASYGGGGGFGVGLVQTYYQDCTGVAGNCYCPHLACLPGTDPHCGIGTFTFTGGSCGRYMGAKFGIIYDNSSPQEYFCTPGWSWVADGPGTCY